jgi:ribosome-binding factor A
MDERRTARVSVAIREELTEIIGFEMADPRLAGVTVSGVEVSSDGKHAHIKVALEGEKELSQAVKALDHAAGFLRHQLASRLDLRLVPELRFSGDRFPGADERVALLLKRAEKSRGRQ